ncbi:MAG: tetratricopeptide repeat protein [Oceanicaulis sp.]
MDIIGANTPAGADTANGAAGLIKDGTDQSFMADVIEPSREVPVPVDFWAPWCGPCRQLGPIIEKAVRAANGAVKLVKINIDENPGVAGQLRIQSIPAVIAFSEGQPVDGFMGALPESQIKEFINRVSGNVSEEDVAELVARADASLAQGDAGGAAQDYAGALQMDPENPAALAGMARIQLSQGDRDQAQAFLDAVPEPKKTHPAVAAVRASMELAAEAGDAKDLDEAEDAARRNPKSAEAAYDLGKARLASGDAAGAADSLLDSIGLDRDWNDAAARKLLLRVFDAAGPNDPVVKAGRRRLSSLLFS